MTPEEVLAGIVARRNSAPPAIHASPTTRVGPAALTLKVQGERGPATDLVRCADCRYVRYRSEPPPMPGNPWKEWLECDHGQAVTMRELTTRVRVCAQFDPRPPSRQEVRE